VHLNNQLCASSDNRYASGTFDLVKSQIKIVSAYGDVRFGSKADICGATSDVRLTPNSDRESG
jgi:hypothetical protein